MAIPVKSQPALVFGQITRIEEVQSDWGDKVYVYIAPADPNATSERVLRMKNSGSGQSPLQKFFKSFNRALVHLISGSSPIASEQQCINAYVQVRIEPQEAVRDGNYIEWNENYVDELYETKEALDAAWKSHVETMTAGVRKATPPPPEYATPELLPDSIVKALKAAWDSSGKNPDKLWASVQGWGFTREQVLAAVQ